MKRDYKSILLFSYVVALIISVPNRIFLVLFHVDPLTGLYSGGGVLPRVFNMGLLVFIVFWFIMTLLRRSHRDYPVRFKCPVASVLCSLTGVLILLGTTADTLSAFGAFAILPDYASPGVWTMIVLGIKVVSGFFGGLALILFGLREDLKKLKIFGIFPAIWQIIVLIERFTGYAAPTQISENLLSILFMLFAPVFLLAQSRTFCGFKPRDSRNYLISSGFAASLVGFSLSVPGFIVSIVRGDFAPRFEWAFLFNVYVLVFSLYAAVFLFNYIWAIRKV